MKKFLFLLVMITATGMLFSQESETGRISSVKPDIVVTKKIPVVEKIEFISDQDDPDNSKYFFAEDLYVAGSIGFGFDIVNGESFGFNTMIMRENNLRILFEDNSTGTFPGNDWIIEINSTVNGGDSYYAVQDATAGVIPFKIMAGAPADALFVNDNGNVGFGTSNPVTKVHLKNGNTPTVRLEQDNTGGWTPQTWDIAGNEANFFIRDATNGSTLPFRIQPGAPSSSLTIKSTGNVGIGTWNPTENLEVVGNVKLNSSLKMTPLLTVPATPGEGDIYMDGNDHLLKLYDGTEWLTWSSDNQQLGLTEDTLSISNGNFVTLSAFLDNTDEQDLVDATLTGTILQIDIENGASVSVDLYPLIEDLEARVTALEEQINGVESIKYTSARLFQNVPNPYKDQTVINYFIPEDVSKAILQITNVQGNILREISISERGKGSIIIDESHTKEGTYFYSLVIDSRKTGSKIMIRVD